MMMSTANQAYVFLATVYGGLVIGLFFDLYRMVRRILRPGKWITGIMDLIFWILVAFFSFLILFNINDGEVRLYSFLGLALGWGLYVLSLSQLIMWVFDSIYKVVAKILGWIFNIIKWPFKKIIKGSRMFITHIKKIARIRKDNSLDKNINNSG